MDSALETDMIPDARRSRGVGAVVWSACGALLGVGTVVMLVNYERWTPSLVTGGEPPIFQMIEGGVRILCVLLVGSAAAAICSFVGILMTHIPAPAPPAAKRLEKLLVFLHACAFSPVFYVLCVLALASFNKAARTHDRERVDPRPGRIVPWPREGR